MEAMSTATSDLATGGRAQLAPARSWILHSTMLLGSLTERWIQTQVDSQIDFDARLLGRTAAPSSEPSTSWIVASDDWRLRACHRGMFMSGGHSLALLERRFRANPPSAVHAHFGIVATQHRQLARRLDSALVASFYGYDASMDRYIKARAWRARYRRLFRDVAAVVVEGPVMAARVAALGCPDSKLHIVRLPADAAGLSGVVRRPPSTFVVVAAGRFVGKKGFDTGVRAFARALRGRDARLLMVGGGELEADYRQLARDEGIAEQVTWLGSLPFREFMSQIAGASVAVFPSRPAPDGDTEGGAPVTLIETQWLGVPALVSDHDDLPFVAAPGGPHILPPTDVDAWAETLRSLYDSPGQLEEMGSTEAAFARANHSPEANAKVREALYAQLAGLAPPANGAI
jgi:colanic acid/amylovoran/stewartan biosynthesis glycosyltransferase WcaL/AmsK/CpsK